MSDFDWSNRPSGKLSVDGAMLEYACFGPAPGEAPTIVMLHEGLGCVELWRDVPKRIADRTGFGVFVYSRQGYGRSDPVVLPRPLDFQTREALGPLPSLLDKIGFRKGILLGHSDGATIAAIYAGSIEDHRVRGLILMAPHFFTEEMGLAAIAGARDSFATTDLASRMAKYHDDPEGAFRGWADVWLDPEYRAWNVTDVIDYLRIPTLAIQGREDQYGTLAQLEALEERSYAPVDTLVLENCKHSPHLEYPDLVLDAIADFTARLSRIEAASVEPA